MNITYLLQKADSGRNPHIEFLSQPWSHEETKERPFSVPFDYELPEMFSKYWQDRLENEMRVRKFSVKTQNTYIYFNKLICRTFQKFPEDIYNEDITEFLALLEKDKNYSASSMNLTISALKFFYRNVFKSDIVKEQKRPYQNKNLPVILSEKEIVKVLSLEKNPKHKLLLMLVYSSGLRVSEVVALKKEHIDLSRQAVFIRQGKGRKDRYTMLSEKAAEFLKWYYEYYRIDKWIFPGQQAASKQQNTRHLSVRAAQSIFYKAIKRAKIHKEASIHGLRHSFATHLLENGTDIRYIQSLLGHSNLRTTERYTHVARRSVLKIKSPLDSII
ncbi:MAG: site-specific integrase [Treponema sp.]|nr:site-specific integrase [Treponema sp.]